MQSVWIGRKYTGNDVPCFEPEFLVLSILLLKIKDILLVLEKTALHSLQLVVVYGETKYFTLYQRFGLHPKKSKDNLSILKVNSRQSILFLTTNGLIP